VFSCDPSLPYGCLPLSQFIPWKCCGLTVGTDHNTSRRYQFYRNLHLVLAIPSETSFLTLYLLVNYCFMAIPFGFDPTVMV
jgi:hypothetical protein